jgi:hypothetical protein
MRIKKILFAIAVISCISFAFFTVKKAKNATTVFIYGLVINEGCKYEPDNTVEYMYNIVEEAKYKEATTVIREKLLKQYPNSKRIETGSSIYQYGADAAAAVIIKQTVQYVNGCQYSNFLIRFGKSQEEAIKKATVDCNNSNRINCEILLNKTW